MTQWPIFHLCKGSQKIITGYVACNGHLIVWYDGKILLVDQLLFSPRSSTGVPFERLNWESTASKKCWSIETTWVQFAFWLASIVQKQQINLHFTATEKYFLQKYQLHFINEAVRVLFHQVALRGKKCIPGLPIPHAKSSSVIVLDVSFTSCCFDN